MEGLKIGVIFGGRSVEHEVSIVTAHQVMAVLAEDHTVVPIYITREGRWLTGEGLNDLGVYKERRWDEVGEEAFIPPVSGFGGLQVPARGRLKTARRIELDCVVVAVHGTFGEDGTLQGLLELADLPYTGSGVVGSAVGMDKRAMKAAFRAAGLPVADDVEVNVERLNRDPETIIGEIETTLGYPVFVKPARLGSSVGIGKAADAAELRAALDVARSYDAHVIVERSMAGSLEINCSVLGGPGHEHETSVCEQPIAWTDFLSFRDKYMRGSKAGDGDPQKVEGGGKGMAGQDRRIPAPLSDELTKQVQENALRAFAAVHASGVARVDSFVDEDSGETWVMEINTVPGSFSFYLWEATGKSFKQLMAELLAIALETHRRKSDLLFSFESGMLEGKGPKSG